MDLTMILADTNNERRVLFREMVRTLASRKDFTYHLYAAGKADAWKDIPREQFPMLCLCLIHLDYPDALELGQQVYEASPFCRVVYYETGDRNVTDYLPSRPVRYLNISPGKEAVWNCLNEQYRIIQRDSHYLHYEDRYQIITHPYSGLQYFYSQGRMVYYQTPVGQQGPLRRTLDQIQQMLAPDCYIRCHKSYLVRSDLCTGLDKAARELILSDGSRIPVSRAYWKEITEHFCQNAAFTGEKRKLADEAADP